MIVITKEYLQELQQQREFVEVRWQKHIGLPAIQKLQLYCKLQSAVGGSFTAVDADDKFVYVCERVHELFTGAEEDTFVYHKVPLRYLSMTDAQVLAERRADECILAGIDRVEDAKRYHAIRDKYRPEYDYEDWSHQDFWL